MPHIYLRHPVHGSKVAFSDSEAVYDRSNGWEDYDHAAPGPVEVPSFFGGPGTPLPDDFPGRTLLIEGGFVTLESLAGKTGDELQQVKGIGAATALRILDALEA